MVTIKKIKDMNIKKISLFVAVLAFAFQSCEKITYSDPTRMEDYLAVPEFTPDWTDPFTNLDDWEYLKGTWTPGPDGLTLIAGSRLQDRAKHKDVIVALESSFTYEFEVRLYEPTGKKPKAGVMIGELGRSAPPIFIGLDFEGENHSVVKYLKVGGLSIKLQSPNGPIDVAQFHTIRVTKEVDELFVYIDGSRAHYEKGDQISSIEGGLCIAAESCTAEYKFVSYKAGK